MIKKNCRDLCKNNEELCIYKLIYFIHHKMKLGSWKHLVPYLADIGSHKFLFFARKSVDENALYFIPNQSASQW